MIHTCYIMGKNALLVKIECGSSISHRDDDYKLYLLPGFIQTIHLKYLYCHRTNRSVTDALNVSI